MAIIPSFFMDAVVSLGIELPNKEKYWVGTGFLVGRKETDNSGQSTIYIITNKHVVNNQKMFYVRFNNAEAAGVRDMQMDLFGNDGKPIFSAHPLSNVDLDDHALTLEQMQKTGVNEGSLVYALGFPMNLVEAPVKAPICRLGCISRIVDAFASPKNAASFLVDAQTFPGNSGGPIVSRPEYISISGTPNNDKANLIGVLSAYIPYREMLYSRQTGRNRMEQEENSGLTIVHPVDRIKEVVEMEWQRVEAKGVNDIAKPPVNSDKKDVAPV